MIFITTLSVNQFQIKGFYQNKSKFNSGYFKKIQEFKIKNLAYVINLDKCKLSCFVS